MLRCCCKTAIERAAVNGDASTRVAGVYGCSTINRFGRGVSIGDSLNIAVFAGDNGGNITREGAARDVDFRREFIFFIALRVRNRKSRAACEGTVGDVHVER